MNLLPNPRMRTTITRATSLCVGLTLAGCGESNHEQSHVITLFAAASTTDVVRDVAARFTQETGIEVRLSFAASSTLARQIEEGAEGDLYLSADDAWMDHLQARGLIDRSTRINLLSNEIVVIAPANHPFEWTPRDDAGSKLADAFSGRFSIGDPSHVPVGRYAVAALESLGEWEFLDDARFVRASDARAALRFVELREVSMGIVYATDVAMSAGRVAVIARLPQDSHPPIRYPLAMLSGSSNRDDALHFIRFLQGDIAADRFRAAGFLIDATQPILVSESKPPTAPISQPIFSNEEREIFLLSLRVAVASVLLSLVPGVAFGWLLARTEFRGKSLVDALVHLPLVVPPVALGWLLMITLGANSSMGSFLRERVGVDIAFTWLGAAVASAVMGFPLLVRSVRLGVELVDRRLEEAARTLGATPLRVLYSVTLPLAIPGIVTGTLLAFARSLGEFGATITFAGNIAGETRTLPVAIYTLAQTPNGDAATLRLVALSVGLALFALLASETIARRWRHRLGGT